MGRDRKAYEPYRPALTEAEIRELQWAVEGPRQREVFKRIAREAAAKQLEGAVNEWANGRRTREGALPEDEEICQRFPEVDPRGKYSEIDMKFARRRQEILTVLQTRDEGVVGSFRSGIFAYPAFTELEERVEQLAREQRILTRAAKLCHDDKAAEELLVEAQSYFSKPDVLDLERAYTGMEYLLGIRTGEPPKDVAQFFREQMKLTIDASHIRANSVAGSPAQPIEVRMSNLETRMVQYQFAQPENWGKPPQEFAQLRPPQADAILELSSEHVAGNVLDALYRNAPDYIPRTQCILINGKSIEEILRESKSLSEDYVVSSRDFREGREQANQLIAAALTKGDTVEAFVPDPSGRLPSEPLRLEQKGFEIAHVSPVTLNAWERFWHRFAGLYPEKAARAEEYQKYAEAHERVRHTVAAFNKDKTMGKVSAWSPNTKEAYFDQRALPDVSWRHKPIEGGYIPFGMPDADWVSLAGLYLFAKGERLETIVDPAKSGLLRKRAGDAVIEMFTGKDATEEDMKRLFVDGTKALKSEIARYAKEHGIDPGKLRTGSAEDLLPLQLAGQYAYFAGHVAEAMTIVYADMDPEEFDFAPDPCFRDDPAPAKKAAGELESASMTISAIEQIQSAKDALTYSELDADALKGCLSSYLAGTEALKAIKAGTTPNIEYAILQCDAIGEIAEGAAQSPEAYAQLRDAVVSGKLAAGTRITTVPPLVETDEPKQQMSIDTGSLPFMQKAPQKAANAPQAPVMM